MEKNYEKPEVQVVRYRKKVKTTTWEEFTDSAGVLPARIYCETCGQYLFTESENDTEADWARYEQIFVDHMRTIHNG